MCDCFGRAGDTIKEDWLNLRDFFIWSSLRKRAKRAEGTPLIGLRVSPVRDSEFPTGPSRKHVFRMKFGP